MVLDSVVSSHTRRNYAKALDDLFALSAGWPLPRSLLMEYRAYNGLALGRLCGPQLCGGLGFGHGIPS
ncbi:hypothetical protein [Granulicella sp. S156]|jgi:hypothetical protein|uniref:hypothetical protein n=1 Tax=Granulicella sp. S156 TaxID=1747224 RepID=UPI00131AEB97|nr:hypothetical protein [Granulicella sp. S156]